MEEGIELSEAEAAFVESHVRAWQQAFALDERRTWMRRPLAELLIALSDAARDFDDPDQLDAMRTIVEQAFAHAPEYGTDVAYDVLQKLRAAGAVRREVDEAA